MSIEINNWKELENLRPGDWFYVDGDHFKSMGILAKVKYLFLKEYRRKTKEGIQCLLNKIVCAKKPNDVKDELVKKVFFNTLAFLPRELFKRKIHSSFLEVLGGNTPEVWSKLGNFNILKGRSRSYQILQGEIIDENGSQSSNIIGIFKPATHGTFSLSHPSFRQKMVVIWLKTVGTFFRGSALETGSTQYLTEVAAYKIYKLISKKILNDDEKNFIQIPKTKVKTFEFPGKGQVVGSYQEWVKEDHEEVHSYLKTDEYYDKQVDIGKKLPSDYVFDLAIIVDWLIASSDRKGSNWLFVKEEEGIKGIVLIDNGWALFPSHPTSRVSVDVKKLYLWKKFSFLDRKMTNEGIKKVDLIWAEREELKNKLEGFYKKYSDPVSGDRIERLMERMEVLCEISDKKTIKQIGECYLKSDLEKFRSKRIS